MSFTFVQGPTEGPATGTTITGTVAGNFLVVYVGGESNDPAVPAVFTGLEINAGVGTQLTWTEAVSAVGAFAVFSRQYRHSWWISSAIPGGIAGSIQVRVTGGTGAQMAVHEIACGDTQIHVDGAASGNAAATVNPTIVLPTLEPNGMVISAITASHANPTVGAGYTDIPISNSTSFVSAEYDVDHGAAGNISVPYVAAASTYLITAFSLQEGPAPVPFSGLAKFFVLER